MTSTGYGNPISPCFGLLRAMNDVVGDNRYDSGQSGVSVGNPPIGRHNGFDRGPFPGIHSHRHAQMRFIARGSATCPTMLAI